MPNRARDIAALLAFVDARQNVPHEIGRRESDCAGFVLDAVKVQNGRGRASSLKWSTPKSALKAIKKFGSLEAAFDHYFQRIPPSLAMRGDIAGVADETFGIHPMIIEGGTLVGPGETGNRRLPRAAMIMAWSATAPQPRKRKPK